MYRHNRSELAGHIDFIILELISLELAYIVAALIRHHQLLFSRAIYRELVVILVLLDLLVIVLFNTFHNVLKRDYTEEFVATLKQCFSVFFLVLIYVFAIQMGVRYSRILFFLMLIFHVLISYGLRCALKAIRLKIGKTGAASESMLVVADPDTAEATVNMLVSGQAEGYRITGVILNGSDSRSEINGIPVVAGIDGASTYICQEWVDSVYLSCREKDENVRRLCDDCYKMGITVHQQVVEMSTMEQNRTINRIGEATVLTTSMNSVEPVKMLIKRLFDIIGGLIGSIIAIIIMLVMTPFIKAKSPGPVLFKQERVGRNGKRFTIYKIRSMDVGADDHKKDFEEENIVKDGMMFKLDFDPRIIGNRIDEDGRQIRGIGDFMRRHSIDEYPQFFNVLMGQMSLVGTRPPTVDEWEKYKLHHRARLSCKPGITGMWQVSGRSKITDFEEVVKLDTSYITNWSLGLDLKILIKTVGVMMSRDSGGR